MKSFSYAIDSFCRKHPRFGIPRLMLYIVIVSAAVFLLLNTPAGRGLLVFSPGHILRGQVWRLITWIFLPLNSSGDFSGMLFTAIALYFYYFIGSTLEREWGSGKFTIYYLFGMLLHIVYGFAAHFMYGGVLPVYITPMYLNLSMFFAFAVLFPDFTVRLFFVIPIKVKWLALVNAGFFMIELIRGLISWPIMMALLPLVALLNFVLICGHELLLYIRPLTRRASPNVVNFRKEAKRVKRSMSESPYRHKCCVCGKTDTDYPQLEFRYCSQCNGYHCFCSEHINNHIHFT